MATKNGANQIKGGAKRIEGATERAAKDIEGGAKQMAAGAQDEILRLGNIPRELTARGREVWLAGLGAFATVEEEGNKLFNNLVDRGERLEQRGRDQIDRTAREVGEQQKKAVEQVEGTYSRFESVVTGVVKNVLERFDVPTRAEVRSLSLKVDDLSKKIDGLAVTLENKRTGTKATAKAGAKVYSDATSYHVVPHNDGWAVEKEGAQRATSVHETKKDAVAAGRELANGHKPSALVVHKQDRSVQETFTYEEDEQA